MDELLKGRLLEELQTMPQLKYEDLRPVAEPKIELLNEEQAVFYEEIIQFVYMGSDAGAPMKYLLKGYAGTGKTFLISMVIERLLLQGLKVCVTAPTGKAVRVLKKAAQYKNSRLDYRTMHSLLGLRESIDGYGNQRFIQLNKDAATVGDYDVIIHDETSMLGGELIIGGKSVTGLFDYMDMFQVKLIAVGDFCQIPPIGKTLCIMAREEFQREHQIHVGELTQIVRQAKDNPMIELTMKIRKYQGRADILPIRTTKYNPKNLDGVFHLNDGDTKFFYRLLKSYFTSDQFKKDSDFVKVLAWTNKAVDSITEVIRFFVHGKNAPKLCIGEKLLVDKPAFAVSDDITKTPSIGTNSELEILSFEIVEKPYKGTTLKYYRAKITIEGIATKKQIRVIHEDSEGTFRKITEHLVELAKSHKKGSWEAAKAHGEYYQLFKVFAQVKYNYCITCHKAQGSTYANCIVMESDIDKNRKIKERNCIKYTAFTRPSHRLFIAI